MRLWNIIGISQLEEIINKKYSEFNNSGIKHNKIISEIEKYDLELITERWAKTIKKVINKSN